MKVLIEFEDTPTEEDENNVSIKFDFDPPMDENTDMTAAGFLATEVMASIQQHLEEKPEEEKRIITLN